MTDRSYAAVVSSDHPTVQIPIPASLAARVFGRKHVNIRDIEESTGARLFSPPTKHGTDTYIHISASAASRDEECSIIERAQHQVETLIERVQQRSPSPVLIQPLPPPLFVPQRLCMREFMVCVERTCARPPYPGSAYCSLAHGPSGAQFTGLRCRVLGCENIAIRRGPDLFNVFCAIHKCNVVPCPAGIEHIHAKYCMDHEKLATRYTATFTKSLAAHPAPSHIVLENVEVYSSPDYTVESASDSYVQDLEKQFDTFIPTDYRFCAVTYENLTQFLQATDNAEGVYCTRLVSTGLHQIQAGDTGVTVGCKYYTARAKSVPPETLSTTRTPQYTSHETEDHQHTFAFDKRQLVPLILFHWRAVIKCAMLDCSCAALDDRVYCELHSCPLLTCDRIRLNDTKFKGYCSLTCQDHKLFLYVFVDNTNIFLGAQWQGGNRYPHTRVGVKDLVATIEMDRVCVRREVVGSGKNGSIWKEWKQLNYNVRVGVHCTKSIDERVEQFVDDALQSAIAGVIHDRRLEHRPQKLVLVTGDGNTEGPNSFCGLAAQAARKQWQVEVWSWEASLSKHYRTLAKEYPLHVHIMLLDPYRDKITYTQ